MKKTQLKYIIWKEGKHVVAQCLNFDVSSFGKTKKEAVDNLTEAISLYFEDSKKSKVQKIERPEVVLGSFVYA